MINIKIYSTVILVLLTTMSFGLTSCTFPGLQGEYMTGYKKRVDNKVEIIVYTSLTCSNCKFLHDYVEKPLYQKYISNSKVNFTIVILPEADNDSMRVSEATLAADEQGKIWEYRDALLTSWDNIGRINCSSMYLLYIAQQIGLDMDLFNHSINSGNLYKKLLENVRRSYSDNIDSIPIILINNHRIVGINPIDNYKHHRIRNSRIFAMTNIELFNQCNLHFISVLLKNIIRIIYTIQTIYVQLNYDEYIFSIRTYLKKLYNIYMVWQVDKECPTSYV